jgi:hypothetical protein
MDLLSQRGKTLYGTYTVITFVVSLLPLFITLFGLVWAGPHYWQVDFLATASVFSSACLLLGAIRSQSNSRLITVTTLLGAAFVPAIVVSLTIAILLTPESNRASLGSVGWWSVFLIDATQICFSSLKLYQLRTPEVTPWPH